MPSPGTTGRHSYGSYSLTFCWTFLSPPWNCGPGSKTNCADYLLRHNRGEAINRALEDINRYLANRGSSLGQHNLPEPQRDRHDDEVNRELDFFHQRRNTLRTALPMER